MALAPLVTAALLVGTGGASTPSASSQTSTQASTQAAPASSAPVSISAKPVAYAASPALRALRGRLAVSIAGAQKGKPYVYGAAGPRAFDCSGLIYYVYQKRLDVSLPRTANAQRLQAVRISKANIQPGDLIFFMSGGRAYHVGIYAGGGKVWHSPRPGQRVQLSKIWTSRWQPGRLR
jgi:cell wall-associated NlpC family hydrolase